MNIVGEIKYYIDDDYAVLKFSEDKRSLSIDIVNVPVKHRSKGIGTELINIILLRADTLGKSVNLSARPIGVTSEEKLQRLVKYYEKFGFTSMDRGLSVVYMSRKPKN